MTESETRLTVRNSIAEIARAAAWLDRFAVGSALPLDMTNRLHVVLDEVLSNVVRHGLRAAADGTREIGLSLRRCGDTVELAIDDDGPEFDPTLFLHGHVAESYPDGRGGGVGLRFVTYLTDDMDFMRRLGRNQLTLRMRLPGGDLKENQAMEIFEAPAEGAVVIHVAGQVNSSNAPQLGQRLASLIERDVRAIVVDLSRLVHMTSAGFRSLLLADKRAGDAGGALVICGLQGLTLELFEIGGFLDMFVVAGSRDDALRQVMSFRYATDV